MVPTSSPGAPTGRSGMPSLLTSNQGGGTTRSVTGSLDSPNSVRCHDRELIRSSPFRNPAQFKPFPKQGFRPEGEPGGQGAFHGEADG